MAMAMDHPRRLQPNSDNACPIAVFFSSSNNKDSILGKNIEIVRELYLQEGHDCSA